VTRPLVLLPLLAAVSLAPAPQASATVNPTDISITTTGPASARAGANVNEAITVRNLGPNDAATLTMTDALPANTAFVSLISPAGWSCTTPAVGANGTVTCTAPVLLNGAAAPFSLIFKPDSSTAAGAIATNTASIATGSTDTTAGNNTSSVTTTITTMADLMVRVSGARVDAGTNLTYNMTLTNIGPSDAVNVHFRDRVPSDTTFVSMSQTSGPAFSISTPPPGAPGGRPPDMIDAAIANLSAGATATFQLVVLVGTGPDVVYGIHNLNFNVTADTPDTDPPNNSTTVDTTVNYTDLEVTKTGPVSVVAGTKATYTLMVASHGSLPALGTTITDVLPAGTTFVSTTQTAGAAFNCMNPAVGTNGTITCSIASFAASSLASFDIVVNVLSNVANGATLSNIATASTSSTDVVPYNNSFTEISRVTTSSDLSIATTGPSRIVANNLQNVAYQIAITNNGPSDAASVVMTDALPAGLTFVSMAAPAGFTCTTPPPASNGTITCTATNLMNAATASFTLVAHVGPIAAVGNPLSDTATVSTATTDPNTGNNTSTMTAATATDIPALSPLMLCLLAAALAVVALANR
jgi:uncharacterized repeat protein (TIGR01451 family)